MTNYALLRGYALMFETPDGMVSVDSFATLQDIASIRLETTAEAEPKGKMSGFIDLQSARLNNRAERRAAAAKARIGSKS